MRKVGSLRELAAEAAYQVYASDYPDSTAVVTGVWDTARNVNQLLHDECVEGRKLRRQPIPFVSLRDGSPATVGDWVMARKSWQEVGIQEGSRGRISEILETTSATSPRGRWDSAAGFMVVVFDAIGAVIVTRSMLKSLELGYAAPLTVSRFFSCTRSIICEDRDFTLGAQWQSAAAAVSTRGGVRVTLDTLDATRIKDAARARNRRSAFDCNITNNVRVTTW